MAIRPEAWREHTADAQENLPDTPEPTLEDFAADIERKRLFEIVEELMIRENSTNEEVLERARAEIRRSCGGVLPPVYDPFSGGGSIPLEAQRLGLPAYGSDLNPVAAMIGKAMIEIPPEFKDLPPIHPGIKERNRYRNAEGLAEGVPPAMVRDRMAALEARRLALQGELASAEVPAPRLHPGLAQVYRDRVAELAHVLHQDDGAEARELVRGLVEVIRLVPEDGDLRIEVRGALGMILALAEGARSVFGAGNAKRLGDVAEALVVQIKMDAGTGFEPVTFRL